MLSPIFLHTMSRMPDETTCHIALTTAPDNATAESLARRIVQSRLCACVNVVPGMQSFYWWKGDVQQDAELLLIMKTTRKKLAELEQCVLEHHPYETPEFVVLPIESGSPGYLDWLTTSVQT